MVVSERAGRVGSVCEGAALVCAPVSGFLMPSEWRWAAGTALLSGSLFVLGFFGLGRR